MLCKTHTPVHHGCVRSAAFSYSERSFTTYLPRRRICVCRNQAPDTDQDKAEGKTTRAPEASTSGAQPRLDDPSQTVVWGGRLPSRRRAITGGLTGLAIVLVSNFGGASSALLSLDGGRLAARLRLDALYPVAGYKRCLDTQNGYEFRYPSRWLSDQRLYQRYAERVEQRSGLDPPPASRRPRRTVAEPTAAYGPPGGTGEENLSVIVAPIGGGFQLEDLGNARDAAERFLSRTIAPEGSNKEAVLINAYERRDERGETYYTMDYTVRAPSFFRHNLSVYAARDGILYTLNGQCKESRWSELQKDMSVAAESFRITRASTTIPGWGTQLR